MRYPDLEPPLPPRPELPAVRETIVASAEEARVDAGTSPGPAEPEEGKKSKKKKKGREKEDEPPKLSRGVETMFRTAYQMHVDLSGLADSKANILISINGLIISVILAAVAPRIRTDLWLLPPTAVVLGTCLVAISCAILAARPRVSRIDPDGGERPPNPNLMFFGGFLSLSREEYEKEVQRTLLRPEELYLGMTRDLYGLGVVLDRKFRLLRLAYTVFMVGLAIGVLLYLIVYAGMSVGDPAPAALPIPGLGTLPQ